MRVDRGVGATYSWSRDALGQGRSRRNMSRWSVVATLVASTALVGCFAPLSTLPTASPVGAGKVEGIIVAGTTTMRQTIPEPVTRCDSDFAFGFPDLGHDSSTYYDDCETTESGPPLALGRTSTDDPEMPRYWFITVDGGMRYGVSDLIDLGVYLRGFSNLHFDVGIRLLDTGIFSLAVVPGITSGLFDLFRPELPVLMEVEISGIGNIQLGLKYTLSVAEHTDSGLKHFVGGNLGAEFFILDEIAMGPHATFVTQPGSGYWLAFLGVAFRTNP